MRPLAAALLLAALFLAGCAETPAGLLAPRAVELGPALPRDLLPPAEAAARLWSPDARLVTISHGESRPFYFMRGGPLSEAPPTPDAWTFFFADDLRGTGLFLDVSAEGQVVARRESGPASGGAVASDPSTPIREPAAPEALWLDAERVLEALRAEARVQPALADGAEAELLFTPDLDHAWVWRAYLPLGEGHLEATVDPRWWAVTAVEEIQPPPQAPLLPHPSLLAAAALRDEAGALTRLALRVGLQPDSGPFDPRAVAVAAWGDRWSVHATPGAPEAPEVSWLRGEEKALMVAGDEVELRVALPEPLATPSSFQVMLLPEGPRDAGFTLEAPDGAEGDRIELAIGAPPPSSGPAPVATEARPPPALRVVSITGHRSDAAANLSALEVELEAEPGDAVDMDHATLRYRDPRGREAYGAGAARPLRFAWPEGAGEDGVLQGGERVRVVFDLPGPGLAPREEVALSLAVEGTVRAVVEVATPPSYGEAHAVALR